MLTNGQTEARTLRSRLRHPIIDADGHWLESAPVIRGKANPMGARLNAIFSSDVGHFDVPDMTDVVPEAYELVEHGLLTDDDFGDFMFANAVRFRGEVNPDFFTGTAVESQAAVLEGS